MDKTISDYNKIINEIYREIMNHVAKYKYVHQLYLNITKLTMSQSS